MKTIESLGRVVFATACGPAHMQVMQAIECGTTITKIITNAAWEAMKVNATKAGAVVE